MRGAAVARPPLPVGTWGAVRVEAVPGGWRARTRFRDYDGVTRDVERRGPTKGAARAALTSALTERSTPSGDEITAESRVREVLAVWYAEHEDGWATNTRRRYRSMIDDHLEPGIGALRVREATVPALDRLIKRLAADVGAPTAKLAKSVLTGALGVAVRHGALEANPMRDVASVTVTTPEPRALTLDEVHAIRSAVHTWQTTPRQGRRRDLDLLDVVDLMLATGARIGEVLAIRWSDVDLVAGTVTICGTVVARDTKPRSLYRQDHTKTRRPRTLRLPGYAVALLMRRQVAAQANPHDVVLPSRVGTLRDPASVTKSLGRVLTEAGLPSITSHALRRTVATALAAELDVRAAADQLGHSSTQVTERHYIERSTAGPDGREVLGRFVSGGFSGGEGR